MPALAEFSTLRKLSRLTWADSDQGQAVAMLAAASAAVRAFCGWQIHAVTGVIVTLDGPGGQVLALPSLRVTKVLSVRIVMGDAITTVTDFIPSVSSGLLRRRRGWPGEFSSIEVTYSGGYDPVPDEIAAVVCSMVDRGASIPAGVSQEGTGQLTRVYTGGAGVVALSDTEKEVLGRYRISRET